MVALRRREAEALLQVEAWNLARAIGTPVRYECPWHGEKFFRTRSRAIVGPGEVAIVWITKHHCAVRLDKLQLATDADVAPLQPELSMGSVCYWLALRDPVRARPLFWIEKRTEISEWVSASMTTHSLTSLSKSESEVCYKEGPEKLPMAASTLCQRERAQIANASGHQNFLAINLKLSDDGASDAQPITKSRRRETRRRKAA